MWGPPTQLQTRLFYVSPRQTQNSWICLSGLSKFISFESRAVVHMVQLRLKSYSAAFWRILVWSSGFVCTRNNIRNNILDLYSTYLEGHLFSLSWRCITLGCQTVFTFWTEIGHSIQFILHHFLIAHNHRLQFFPRRLYSLVCTPSIPKPSHQNRKN